MSANEPENQFQSHRTHRHRDSDHSRVYYHLFRVQIRDDMRQTALLLEELEDFRNASVSDFRNVRVRERVTWIAADGTVLLDNEADPATMENHSDRPEVKEALDDGEGEAVRGSDTLGISTYYFALRMSDGTVLRIAQDAHSRSARDGGGSAHAFSEPSDYGPDHPDRGPHG